MQAKNLFVKTLKTDATGKRWKVCKFEKCFFLMQIRQL